MDMTACPKCSGNNIVPAKLSGMVGIFATSGSRKFKPKGSQIVATVCTDCGAIYDWRAETPERLKG